MIKRIFLICTLAVFTTGCEKIGNKLFDIIDSNTVLEASVAQDQKIEDLYRAAEEKDREKFLSMVETEITSQMEEQPELFDQVVGFIPEGEHSDPEVINYTKTYSTQLGKVTTVVKEYKYPNSIVRVTTVFKGHDGEDKVIGFHINVTYDEAEKKDA